MYLGRIAFVEDVMWVKYSYATLRIIPRRLVGIMEHLDSALAQMETEISRNSDIKSDPNLLPLLCTRLSYCNDTLKSSFRHISRP